MFPSDVHPPSSTPNTRNPVLSDRALSHCKLAVPPAKAFGRRGVDKELNGGFTSIRTGSTETKQVGASHTVGPQDTGFSHAQLVNRCF